MARRLNFTLTFDEEIYNSYRNKVGRGNVSRTIENIMRNSLAEPGSSTTTTTDTAEDPAVEYRRLKHDFDQALDEVHKRQKYLEKEKVFGELSKMAISLGVTPADQSKMSSVIPKMEEQWKGSKEDMESFILFLEAVKIRNDLTRKMKELRARL